MSFILYTHCALYKEVKVALEDNIQISDVMSQSFPVFKFLHYYMYLASFPVILKITVQFIWLYKHCDIKIYTS